MQIGSKVVCAWSSDFGGLTTGKEYTVLDMKSDHGSTYINIMDDFDRIGTYDSKRFMTVEEVTKQTQENSND